MTDRKKYCDWDLSDIPIPLQIMLEGMIRAIASGEEVFDEPLIEFLRVNCSLIVNYFEKKEN